MSALVHGVADMVALPFMARAFVAGGAIALASGLAGSFLVMRRQTFAADALSHVAFTGSVAALVLGVDTRLGLFVACVAVAVAMALPGRRAMPDDVSIGSTFAFVLGIGVMLLAVYSTSARASGGVAGVSVLFGSILGLSVGAARSDVIIAGVIVVALCAGFRPLVFTSIDASVAEARGLPVRMIGVGFLALVGLTAGVATQAVGALMLLGLIAAPAGAAARLSDRPGRAASLSAVIALGATWCGLVISYAAPSVPPSFAIVAVASATFAAAASSRRLRRARRA